MTTYAEIWKSLSAVDCAKHIEKKGGLSYLSWAWAWAVLMDKYPQAVYTIHEEQSAADGTVECRVSVQIDECERMMWLPVMDYKNNALPNPDKRKISDTRMRCLVKCLAMFGLGHYIYAGEDLPRPEQEAGPISAGHEVGPISAEQAAQIHDLIVATGSKEELVCEWMNVSCIEAIASDKFDTVITALKAKQSKQAA